MRPLGVGVVFVPTLLPFLASRADSVDVLEIEPQTLWQLSRAGGADSYRLNRDLFATIEALPFGKLIHSVGLPFGGSKPLDVRQIDLIGEMADRLSPPWISDHLSFNAFPDGDGFSNTGFFLPLQQTRDAATAAAAKIQALSHALRRPAAFETGVNYLKPVAGEQSDGEFFRTVAEAADCGILLDVHNLWVNECNGRDRVDDVLSAIPLERVWEIHVAGGSQLHGHQLDAHSGAVPDAVWDALRCWIPRMPNVGAVVFEILDDHVATLGERGIASQIETMRQLWASRAPADIRIGGVASSPAEAPGPIRVVEWEGALSSLVIGRRPIDEHPRSALRNDPGLKLFQELVFDTRAGFISQGLHYTTTLLLCALGPAGVQDLMHRFCESCPPELFASAESANFARFLIAHPPAVPFLVEVLEFEHALVRASLYGECAHVRFEHDPASVFESLAQGRMPDNPARVDAVISVRAD
jgi:uncharacterized protein (UPF0276 family)